MKLKFRDFHTSIYECAIPLKTKQLYKYRYKIMSNNIMECEEKFRNFKLNQEQEKNYVDEWNKVWCVYQFRWNKQEYFNEFQEQQITDTTKSLASKNQDTIAFQCKQLFKTDDDFLSEQIYTLVFQNTKNTNQQQQEEIRVLKHQEIYLNYIFTEITFEMLGKLIANFSRDLLKDLLNQSQNENSSEKYKITLLENQIISNQKQSSSEIYMLKQQIQSSNQTIIQLEQQLSARDYQYMVDIQQMQYYANQKALDSINETQLILKLQYQKAQFQSQEIKEFQDKSKSNEYLKKQNDQLKKQLEECEKVLQEVTDKINEKEKKLMEMENKYQQLQQVIIFLKKQVFMQKEEIENTKKHFRVAFIIYKFNKYKFGLFQQI